MKKSFMPIVLLAGMSLGCLAQSASLPQVLYVSASPKSKSKKEMKGDRQFFVYSYDKAIESYTSEKNLSIDGQRKLAESYYKMREDTLAVEAYAKLLRIGGGNVPDDHYNYSMALRSLHRYNESAESMDRLVALNPNDLRARDYLANKSQLNSLLKNNGNIIKRLDMNTNAEDFAPAFYKDKIVFASTRTTKMFPSNSNRNGKPYLSIYVADIRNEQLGSPESFDKDLNGKMNEGTASFCKSGTCMAYTENNYDLKKKELVVNMEIYFRDFVDGEWSEPEAFSANNKTYSVGHPALSKDGRTMYFTSDMPGGFGKADIYRVTKNENGPWSTPENLGSTINTEGDEVFPFYEENQRILYFASNGHFGLGGLDLFSSPLANSGFGTVTNMGAPLNTSSDDLSIIVDSSATKGYFASNRPGGAGYDDIYLINFARMKKINGTAIDVNNKLLANTFITLFDENSNVLDTATTSDNGAFTFTVETNKSYKLTGKKPEYIDGTAVANTYGPDLNVKADVLLLTPMVSEPVALDAPLTKKPIAKSIAKNSSIKSGAIRSIYFDLNRYNIRPDAKTELDLIVKELNENPGMEMSLRSYTDCRASRAYNQMLSNQRAKMSADYVKSRISNPFRITTKGYGETKLVNSCDCEGNSLSSCSEEEHQMNRRTEFRTLLKN